MSGGTLFPGGKPFLRHQNLFKRYLSDPVEHIYVVFKFRNLVRKKCPFSGKSLTLSTLNKRRSSAEVVTRLAVAPNIV